MPKAEAKMSFRVDSGGCTDVGRRRDHNEDTILVESDIGLYAVCDGVGGHSKGEVASSLAAIGLDEYLRSGERPKRRPGMSEGAALLAAAVRSANADILRESDVPIGHGGMGSTCVAMHVVAEEGRAEVANVGDSRCYRLRGGKLEQLTEDHNVINDAKRLDPNIDEEMLAQLPTNVVTRALGMDHDVEADVSTVKLRPGDVFVLCSDGLHGMISDDAIRRTLQECTEAGLAAELLVDQANEAGGRDNIGVVVVRIDSEAAAPDSEAAIEVSGEDGDDYDYEDGIVMLPPSLPPPKGSIEPGEEVVAAQVVSVRGNDEPMEWVVVGKCAGCDEDLLEGAVFCGACGAKVKVERAKDDDADDFSICCEQCDAELVPGTRFCVECGTQHDMFE
jgi:protein phosphatase